MKHSEIADAYDLLADAMMTALKPEETGGTLDGILKLRTKAADLRSQEADDERLNRHFATDELPFGEEISSSQDSQEYRAMDAARKELVEEFDRRGAT